MIPRAPSRPLLFLASWGSVAALSMLLACGGDGGTAPEGGGSRGLRVVAGGGQTDTIGATFAQALVMEVRDATGHLASGVTVRFESIQSSDGAYLFVSPLSVKRFSSFASDETDAQGRAKTVVALSNVAGTPKVLVTVPELGLIDTVSFTSKPAAPAKIKIGTRDTVVQPSASYSLHATVTDRVGNPTPSVSPTYRGIAVVSVSSSGQVIVGPTFSRGMIVVTYGDAVDTAKVSVLPRLSLVVNGSGQVASVNTDGTDFLTLATSNDASLSPHGVKSTTGVVYYQGNPGYDSRVWITTPGSAPRALAGGPGGSAAWPRFSPDGTWVYYVGGAGPSLWRIHPDGTGLDSLAKITQPQVYSAPTVSPDGRTVAVEDVAGVNIVDVASRTSRILAVDCGQPRYSPDGSTFACYRARVVRTVKTDGTGAHLIGSFTDSYGYLDDISGVDWTPDGEWLLISLGQDGLTLLKATDGTQLPLMLPRNYTQASFVR